MTYTDNITKKYVLGKEDLVPFVFIHGDMQNHTVFSKIAEMMQKLGHTTFSFDLPGHGLSEFSEPKKDLLQLLGKLLDEKELKKPIIVGHSSGGIIAIEYVTKTQNVTSLVLINSPIFNPKYINLRIDLNPIYETYRRLSVENFQGQEFVDYTKIKELTDENIRRIGLKTTDPAGLLNNISFYSSLPYNEEIYNLDIPILIIASDDDGFIPLEFIKKCAKKMKKSKVIILSGGHNTHLSKLEKMMDSLKQSYQFLVGQ